MMFKNSLKLLVANFSVFWKVTLYKLISLSICILLLLPVFPAWGNCLNAVNFSELFLDFADNTMFVNTSTFLNSLFVLVDTFIKAVGVLFTTNTFAAIYSIFIVFLLLPFLFGLSSIPTGEGLYSYMASLTKSNFTGTYIRKIGTSCVYSLYRTLISLPICAVYGVIIYYLLSLGAMPGIMQIFAPPIIILLTVFMISLWVTTFCGWMPATIVFDTTPAKAFHKGLKAVSRRYFRVLSSVFMIVLFATMFSFLLTTFSLIVIIPLTSVSLIMLEMVMFFESQGMRYYVDLESIISPKKLEHCDSFNKVKNVI